MVHSRTLVADGLTPVHAYALLREAARGGASFLLESVVAGERWGRFSAIGYRPGYELLLDAGGRWSVNGEGPGAIRDDVDALEAIAPLFAPREPPPATMVERFAQAHVGYLGWEVIHAIDRVPRWPDDAASRMPVARFLAGCTVVVLDALAQTLTIVASTKEDVDRAHADLERAGHLRRVALPDRRRMPDGVVTNLADADFEAKVRRAQEYIAAGDAFQIVLARTFSVPQAGRDPLDVYRAMRVINPSPYMFFFDLPATERDTRMQVLGASPETLVRLENAGIPDKRTMTVRPLAGTRRRGATPAEDLALEKELLADPKERAEHVMLIDLGRNDVGRVADVGSVVMERTMEIERFSHVMHIVSEVSGQIDLGQVSPVDVLRSAFPAGTLSGAPKLRAMQIIRELEACPRGIYGGAVGYATASGQLDFAIAIRTAVCRGGFFEVTAGAGVVEASVPSEEAQETRNKASAVLASIAAAEPLPGMG